MPANSEHLARGGFVDAIRVVADCRERVALVDGRRVIVCPVDPKDASAEQQFVTALSPGSRYRRFHFGLRNLPEQLLREMTEIDQWQHVALVARPETADRTIVAALAPMLDRHGIVIAGLDVIDGRLIEVNVTCPGGMHKTDALLGTDLSGVIVRRLLHHEDSLPKGKVLA